MRALPFPVLSALLPFLLAAPARAQPHIERIPFGEAIQRALARNSSVQIALQDVSRVHGILREVRSASLPTLTGNAVYTRLDADRTTTALVLPAGGGGPTNETRIIQPRDTVSGNLQLAVPLIAPQHWVQWSHAAEQLDVAQLSVEEVRRQIAVTTARAYVGVLAQHRLVEANQRAVDNSRDHFQDAKARLDAGTGNRLDLIRATQELSTSRSQLAFAQTGLVRSQEALGILAGGDAPLDSTDDLQLPAVPGAPAQALRDAEELRSDIRTQRRRLEAAQHVVRDTYADFLPLLVGVAQPFVSSAASLTTPSSGWQAQLVLAVPFYDGGFRYGALEERRALRDEARELLDAALRQARSDVRAAFDGVQRADEALLAARDASRLAAQALDITTLAYHTGATNDLDVVDAERRARDAANAAAIAEDAARQARIDLLSASGRFP